MTENHAHARFAWRVAVGLAFAMAVPAHAQATPEDIPAPERGDASDERVEGDAASPPMPRIAHRPLMEASSTGAELRFLMTPVTVGIEVVVRVRPLGSPGPPQEVVGAWTEQMLTVTLGEEHLHRDGVEYWVVARDSSGGEQAVFASEARPHPVAVAEPRRARWQREALEAHGGHRNTFRLGTEFVQLGPGDGYYIRSTASYAHHLFTALETIEIGVGVTRAASEEYDDPGADYGRADITLRIHPRVRLRAASLLGFSDEGFSLGGGGYLLVGRPFGMHLEVGGEYMRNLGYSGRIRMAFNTVPKLPVGATIEVTTFPIDARPSVRLLLDAAYRFAPDTYVKLIVGYRGQEAATGGVSLGLEAAYSFGP